MLAEFALFPGCCEGMKLIRDDFFAVAIADRMGYSGQRNTKLEVGQTGGENDSVANYLDRNRIPLSTSLES